MDSSNQWHHVKMSVVRHSLCLFQTMMDCIVLLTSRIDIADTETKSREYLGGLYTKTDMCNWRTKDKQRTKQSNWDITLCTRLTHIKKTVTVTETTTRQDWFNFWKYNLWFVKDSWCTVGTEGGYFRLGRCPPHCMTKNSLLRPTDLDQASSIVKDI